MRAGSRPLLWGAALALPAMLLVVSLPSRPMILGALNDAGHAPVLGAFAVVVLLLLRSSAALRGLGGFLAAFAIALAVGAIVELLQSFIGRGAEWDDLVRDALGAAGGLGLAACFLPPRRRAVGLVVFVASFAAAFWSLGEALLAYRERARQWPTVLDLSSARDWYFLRLHGMTIDDGTRANCAAGGGERPGLALRITGGDYPGVTHLEPRPDWSRFHALKLDLTNPDSMPIALTLRVHDRAHDKRLDDRFNFTFELGPASRSVVTIELEDVAKAPASRRMDLQRVDGLILFTMGDPGLIGRRFCVNRVWLE